MPLHLITCLYIVLIHGYFVLMTADELETRMCVFTLHLYFLLSLFCCSFLYTIVVLCIYTHPRWTAYLAYKNTFYNQRKTFQNRSVSYSVPWVIVWYTLDKILKMCLEILKALNMNNNNTQICHKELNRRACTEEREMKFPCAKNFLNTCFSWYYSLNDFLLFFITYKWTTSAVKCCFLPIKNYFETILTLTTMYEIEGMEQTP